MPVWACRREGSSQGGNIIGVANKTFLEQAQSPLSVICSHSGKLARVARSSNSAELQAAADGEGELSYIRLSLRELVGETIPLSSRMGRLSGRRSCSYSRVQTSRGLSSCQHQLIHASGKCALAVDGQAHVRTVRRPQGTNRVIGPLPHVTLRQSGAFSENFEFR